MKKIIIVVLTVILFFIASVVFSFEKNNIVHNFTKYNKSSATAILYNEESLKVKVYAKKTHYEK